MARESLETSSETTYRNASAIWFSAGGFVTDFNLVKEVGLALKDHAGASEVTIGQSQSSKRSRQYSNN